MQFSFKGLNKEPLLYTMPDGTNLTILPPKGKELKAIQVLDVEEKDPYKIVETILNLNANGKVFDYDYLFDTFDVVDISELFKTFGEYLQKLTNQKN